MERGNASLLELGLKANKFIIRRTNDLLSKYRAFCSSFFLSPSSPPFSQILTSFFFLFLFLTQFPVNTSTSSSVPSHPSNSASTNSSCRVPKRKLSSGEKTANPSRRSISFENCAIIPTCSIWRSKFLGARKHSPRISIPGTRGGSRIRLFPARWPSWIG